MTDELDKKLKVIDQLRANVWSSESAAKRFRDVFNGQISKETMSFRQFARDPFGAESIFMLDPIGMRELDAIMRSQLCRFESIVAADMAALEEMLK